MRIGILCVQGAFIEHKKILEDLGCDCVELRKKSDIKDLDGLVLPGGESTVQGKLLRELDMFDEIKKLILQDVPVLATCAGLILLAQKLSEDDTVHFGTLPVTVKRNAFGRQLASFETESKVWDMENFKMTFIRGPVVDSISIGVQVLAKVGDKTVAVKYRNQIGLAFHPELGKDLRVHQKFVEMCEAHL